MTIVSAPAEGRLAGDTPSKRRSSCVLVANPHPRLSDGLRGLLEASFERVFMVADWPSLVEGARKLQPSLMVIDLALAEGRLAALLAELRRDAPASRTLLLSPYDDAGVDAVAFGAGADGIVRKSTLARDLYAAVDAILEGRRFTSS